MRIALVSTAAIATPPHAYGGIERFVAALARALIVRGHEVLVYATGDSAPAGRLRYRFATARWPIDFDREREHARFAWRDLAQFDPDVVHCNLPDALMPSLARGRATVVTIHHERIERLLPLYLSGRALCVALCRQHASSLRELGALPFVYHGLDPDEFPEGDGAGGYVAFVGRIGPEKAPHLAMLAAYRARAPLRVAGPHWSGREAYDEYFARSFMPTLARMDLSVRWLGETDSRQSWALVGGAEALLMPLAWDEPFGLVVIEAMLAGTPVIAFRRGSMPEIVDDGLTGYLVDDHREMAAAIPEARRLDRRRVRARARARFAATRMAADYESVYRQAMRESTTSAAALTARA